MYDAIILSYAGIKSLNIIDQISEIFSVQKLIPSAGQGVISLQCREDDNRIISILKKTNHSETYRRVSAERSVLKVLDGDCETAIGVYSNIKEDIIELKAELFSLDGNEKFYVQSSKGLVNKICMLFFISVIRFCF